MYRLSLCALILAVTLPTWVFAASCDATVSNVHLIRERGSSTTRFRANVAKSSCVRGEGPMVLRLYDGKKFVVAIPVPVGGSGPVSADLPPNTDLSALAISTVNGAALESPHFTLFPAGSKSTPAPAIFTGGYDVRPGDRIIHLSGVNAAR